MVSISEYHILLFIFKFLLCNRMFQLAGEVQIFEALMCRTKDETKSIL